jgi:hypothetical protein
MLVLHLHAPSHGMLEYALDDKIGQWAMTFELRLQEHR